MRMALALALLSLILAPAAGAQRLLGDAEAVAAVEAMLARLGGKTLWAGARTLELEYRGWALWFGPAVEVKERAWRDLQQPHERMELHAPDETRVRAFTPAGGWKSRNGVVSAMSESEHRGSLTFWPGDFYTMLHRFAAADPDLRLRWVPPRRVSVLSTDGESLGWWEIDDRGSPLRWGTVSHNEPLEYVYGPVKKFGAVSFPEWGASLDGTWRFEYSKVELSPAPIPAQALARPEQTP